MQPKRKKAQEDLSRRAEHDGVSVQACRGLFVVFGVCILVLLSLNLGSLLLLSALSLLLRDGLVIVVVALISSGLVLATLLGRATLSLSLALL